MYYVSTKKKKKKRLRENTIIGRNYDLECNGDATSWSCALFALRSFSLRPFCSVPLLSVPFFPAPKCRGSEQQPFKHVKFFLVKFLISFQLYVANITIEIFCFWSIAIIFLFYIYCQAIITRIFHVGFLCQIILTSRDQQQHIHLLKDCFHGQIIFQTAKRNIWLKILFVAWCLSSITIYESVKL